MAEEEDSAGASAAFEGTPIAVPVGPLDGDIVPPLEDEAGPTALIEQTGEVFPQLSRAATARLIRDLAAKVERTRPDPGVGPLVIGTLAGGLYFIGNSQAEKVGFSLAVATVIVGLVGHALHWVAWHNLVWKTRRKLATATGWPGAQVRLGLKAAIAAHRALDGWLEGRRLNQVILRAVQHTLTEGIVLTGTDVRRLVRQPLSPRARHRRRRKKR